MKLYGAAYSRAGRCIWMLEEIGQAYEHIGTSPRGETRTPQMLKLNPNGHVPVLDDNGYVIWESLAINLYLAKKHPGPLTPAGLANEMHTVQWSMWAMTELEGPAGRVLRHGATSEDQATGDDPAADDATLRAALAVLEGALSDKGWLLEGRFTVADLNIASVLSPLPRIRYRFEPFPAVKDWLKTCLFRPAAVEAYYLGVASMRA